MANTETTRSTYGGGASWSAAPRIYSMPMVGAGNYDFVNGPIRYREIDVSIAEMKALVATNKELAPAPGAGFALQFLGGMVIMDYAAAYTESGNNLAINYTGAAGAVASEVVEGTGLWDATSDQVRHIVPATVSPVVVVNAALTLDMQGGSDIAGTGSPVRIKILYAVHDTGL